MRLPRARFDLTILVFLALAAHFLYLHYSGDFFFPDSVTYLTPAHNLLRGLGFSVERDLPETFRTPGYPLFLLPFLAATLNVVPIVVVQHLLAVALVPAVYLVARRITGSRPGALAAGLIMALDIPTIHYANKVLTESLFTFVLFGLFVLVLRIRRRGATIALMLASGAIAGVLVLIRPAAILYFLVPALFLALTENLRKVAAFTAIAVLIPAVWGIRNSVEAGGFTVSSVAGINMLLHRAAPSIAIFEKGAFQDDLAMWQERLTAAANREIVEREHVRSIDDVDGPVAARYYGEIGGRIAFEHPWGLTLVVIRGVLVDLFETDFEAIVMVSRIPSTILEEVIGAVTVGVTLLALLGAVALWKRDRAVAALIVATIGYFVLISAGGESEARFRVPVVPMIALAAGAGVEAMRRGVRESAN